MLKSPWVIAVIVLVVVAALVWLIARGSKRFAAWISEPIEPDKPRWTYVLTPLAAALAPLAAFSALLPSYLNQQRADSKFMAEAQRTRTDAEWFRIRQDTETQEAQFREAEGRFGSPEEKTRAIAALQVADLALRPRPNAGGAADDENYPHFSSTGAQLALALQMEQSADVRAALRQAMGKLVAFAGENNNAVWQKALIHQLADGNRRTQRSLIESLARYSTTSDLKQAAALQNLAVIAPFTAERDRTMIALRDLTKTDMFLADRAIAASLRAATYGAARSEADAALLPDVRARAAHLIDTRDTLADALRAAASSAGTGGNSLAAVVKNLPALPDGLPAVPGLPTGKAPASAVPPLSLQNCFLAGANLWKAKLAGADVTGANFTGANLKHSDLTGANVEKALRLPVSVTKSDKGPDAARLPALKEKYPHFPWAEVEQRQAAAEKAAAEKPAAAPGASPAAPATGK